MSENDHQNIEMFSTWLNCDFMQMYERPLLFCLIADDEEERNLRRVSYLRATKEDRMHIDSDAEAEAHQHAAAASASNNLERTAPATATSLASSQHVQNSEQPLNAPSTPKHSTSEGGGGDVTPRHAHSIQRIRALFGDKAIEEGSASSTTPSGGESLREGWLHCKVTAIAGKVSPICIQPNSPVDLSKLKDLYEKSQLRCSIWNWRFVFIRV